MFRTGSGVAGMIRSNVGKLVPKSQPVDLTGASARKRRAHSNQRWNHVGRQTFGAERSERTRFQRLPGSSDRHRSYGVAAPFIGQRDGSGFVDDRLLEDHASHFAEFDSVYWAFY